MRHACSFNRRRKNGTRLYSCNAAACLLVTQQNSPRFTAQCPNKASLLDGFLGPRAVKIIPFRSSSGAYRRRQQLKMRPTWLRGARRSAESGLGQWLFTQSQRGRRLAPYASTTAQGTACRLGVLHLALTTPHRRLRSQLVTEPPAERPSRGRCISETLRNT
jgi:hypothetical protein